MYDAGLGIRPRGATDSLSRSRSTQRRMPPTRRARFLLRSTSRTRYVCCNVSVTPEACAMAHAAVLRSSRLRLGPACNLHRLPKSTAVAFTERSQGQSTRTVRPLVAEPTPPVGMLLYTQSGRRTNRWPTPRVPPTSCDTSSIPTSCRRLGVTRWVTACDESRVLYALRWSVRLEGTVSLRVTDSRARPGALGV